MYKAYYCMLPANIQQHFVKKYIGNNTSQKSISKALCHLECYSHVSIPMAMYGISLLNSLHVDLTNIKTIRSFRHRYKSILMNECI